MGSATESQLFLMPFAKLRKTNISSVYNDHIKKISSVITFMLPCIVTDLFLITNQTH